MEDSGPNPIKFSSTNVIIPTGCELHPMVGAEITEASSKKGNICSLSLGWHGSCISGWDLAQNLQSYTHLGGSPTEPTTALWVDSIGPLVTP